VTTLLDLFKNIDSTEDADLKHTLEVMFAKSAAQIPEDANWHYEKQDKVVLRGSFIKSLEPLRYLTNVKILVLDENDIRDISPLFDLSNLQHLNLIGNEINSVEEIEKLQSLQELYLGLNLLKDITPLSTLTNLRMLGLRGNVRISDISSLTKLTNLVSLNLSGTSVSDEDTNTLLGALPGCKVIS